MDISPHRLRAIALHFGLSGDAPAAEIIAAIKKYPRTWEWFQGGPERLSLRRGDEEMRELIQACEEARAQVSEPVVLSQQGEQMLEESLDDVRTGDVKEFADVESLIAELHEDAN